MNALSIYLIPKHLNRFLAQYKALDKLSNLDLRLFRQKMAIAKSWIRWIIILCHSIVFIDYITGMIKLIDRQVTIWNKFRAFVTYIPTFKTYIILSIIECIMMYLGCYYRYLYLTISKLLENLDKKSEKEIMTIIQNIHIIYQRMTEQVVVCQSLISPLIYILLAYLAPDLIIYVPTIVAKLSEDAMVILLIIIMNVYLILGLLSISWISTHYAEPYDAVYQLSFDCSLQRLKLVSIFEILLLIFMMFEIVMIKYYYNLKFYKMLHIIV